MKHRISISLLLAECLAAFLPFASAAICPSKVPRYVSPDGNLVALVVPVDQVKGFECYESRVEIHSKSGTLMTETDYSSQDGYHGYGVEKAMWTPDSQFFVFKLDSSGGHSPWHTPVEYYSRAQDKILSLDNALHDAVTRGRFSVAPPDRVTVNLWFSKQEKTVSLSALSIGRNQKQQ